MNLHQLERFPFELEMVTDEKNISGNKLTTIQEFDWVNLARITAWSPTEKVDWFFPGQNAPNRKSVLHSLEFVVFSR